MNALHPLIEELANCADHAERAAWLLACPLSVLLTYQGTIINRLRNAFFLEGVAYVEAEVACARATRVDGLVIKLNPCREPLMAIAARRPFEGTAPAR